MAVRKIFNLNTGRWEWFDEDHPFGGAGADPLHEKPLDEGDIPKFMDVTYFLDNGTEIHVSGDGDDELRGSGRCLYYPGGMEWDSGFTGESVDIEFIDEESPVDWDSLTDTLKKHADGIREVSFEFRGTMRMTSAFYALIFEIGMFSLFARRILFENSMEYSDKDAGYALSIGEINMTDLLSFMEDGKFHNRDGVIDPAIFGRN